MIPGNPAMLQQFSPVCTSATPAQHSLTINKAVQTKSAPAQQRSRSFTSLKTLFCVNAVTEATPGPATPNMKHEEVTPWMRHSSFRTALDVTPGPATPNMNHEEVTLRMNQSSFRSALDVTPDPESHGIPGREASRPAALHTPYLALPNRGSVSTVLEQHLTHRYPKEAVSSQR
eukprot:1160402-Pelagomonas_calceolata.AAC.7